MIDYLRLGSIIEAAIAEGSVPGACLVVVQGDERIEIALGVADQKGTPLTTQSVGRYYSSVKAVTSAVVMQLVEAELLRLDEQISTLLPEWSARPNSEGVPTIRHLLTHTSGLAYPAHGDGPDIPSRLRTEKLASITREATASKSSVQSSLRNRCAFHRGKAGGMG